jgi:hypothetical protein
MNIFVLVRAITCATLFIGLLLVYVPGLLLGSAPVRVDPSSWDYGATRRRRRLWRGKQVTVAPGVERGDTARFPQC